MRLQKISSTIILSANKAGSFRMGVEVDQATVTTEWRGLRHPEFLPAEDDAASTTPAAAKDPNEFCSVKLDAKSLSKFLMSRAIAGTAIACEYIQSLFSYSSN